MHEDVPAALRMILERAETEARELKHGYIGSEHLLLALFGPPGTRAAERLEAAGARYDEVHAQIVRIVGPGEEEITEDEIFPYTSNAVAIYQRVRKEAERAQPEGIGTEHVLRALLRRRGAPLRRRVALAVRALEDCGVDPRGLADQLRRARPDDE